MKKKKGKNSSSKRIILVGTMMICIIISMSTYWIFAYKNKYGYLHINNKIISYKVSDYAYVDGNIIYLKNIDNKIANDFKDKQLDIIKNNDIIDIRMDSGIYNNILSIAISYVIAEDLANYEEVLTINVNLKTDTIVTNEELLNMANTSYKEIATSIYNEYIALPTDFKYKVTDSITDEEMTVAEFNNNSEKYIIRIREKLPDIIKLYIKDNKIYYVVRMNEINKVCYYTHTDINMNNITKEIAEL